MDKDRAEGGAGADDDAWDFRPGMMLHGRYRLVRPLGEGGMGLVWVADQVALQRRVAIKTLRFAGEGLRSRLQREALALASVHHPAVVQVYDYGETDAGVPYVVMELIEGETLAARLDRAGALSAEDAVRLVLPILEGLAAAHAAGVIHRDIKPANVMLTPGPSGGSPKLLDFGIARFERAQSAKVTVDGGLIGTPAYMAPEQVRGEPTDERTDVWGVGTLLYELIAGESPFSTSDILVVLRKVVESPPPYPRHARGLDGRLWAILMSSLRKTPAERIGSALALRDALAGWLAARVAPPATSPSANPQPRSTPVSATLPAGALGPPLPVAATQPAPAREDEDAPSMDLLIRKKLGGS